MTPGWLDFELNHSSVFLVEVRLSQAGSIIPVISEYETLEPGDQKTIVLHDRSDVAGIQTYDPQGIVPLIRDIGKINTYGCIGGRIHSNADPNGIRIHVLEPGMQVRSQMRTNPSKHLLFRLSFPPEQPVFQWHIAPVPPGPRTLVIVAAGSVQLQRDLQVKAGEIQSIGDLSIPPAVEELEIIIKDHAGNPIEGTFVGCYAKDPIIGDDESGAMLSLGSGTTDRYGRLILRGVPSDLEYVTMFAQSRGYRTTIQSARVECNTVNLRLTRIDDSGYVEGIVVDELGLPLKHVSILKEEPWLGGSISLVPCATSNEGGQFRVEGIDIAQAIVTFHINEEGFNPIYTKVAPNTKGVTIRLTRPH